MYGESNMETYITICQIDSQWDCACMTQGTQTGALWQSRRVGWGGRWEGGSGGRDMGVPMADFYWCLTENNKTLWSNCPSIKKINKVAKKKKERWKTSFWQSQFHISIVNQELQNWKGKRKYWDITEVVTAGMCKELLQLNNKKAIQFLKIGSGFRQTLQGKYRNGKEAHEKNAQYW